MKRAYHGDWKDALPSRFINEVPDESVEKNEIGGLSETDDFDFNQTIRLNLMKNIEVLDGIDTKK